MIVAIDTITNFDRSSFSEQKHKTIQSEYITANPYGNRKTRNGESGNGNQGTVKAEISKSRNDKTWNSVLKVETIKRGISQSRNDKTRNP